MHHNDTIMRPIHQIHLALLGFVFATSASAQTTHLHCGRLIDCVDGGVKQEMTVVVEGDRIKEVRKGYTPPAEGVTITDLRDRTVMPGLMDMHVHVQGETNPKRYEEGFRLNDADIALRATVFLERTLMAGFTTVRDLGGSGINVSLRNAVEQGYIRGPRIFTAEKAIATTGGHGDPTNGRRADLRGDPGPAEGVINGPDEAAKAVRQRYKNGADLIKVTSTAGVLSVAKDGAGPQFTIEELEAVVRTAKDYGMHVAAHAHGDEGIRRAVLAGITSIEHGTFMSPETMRLMKEKGTWYVPTISAGKFVADKAEVEGYFPAIVVPKARAVGPQIQDTFGRAYKAGVRIAFGTDCGVGPHGDNAREFIYMVEAGMPPMEAIRSATVSTAELLGRSADLGTIAPGKLADIIAVEGDPLTDIRAMLAVRFVMKEGTVYKR